MNVYCTQLLEILFPPSADELCLRNTPNEQFIFRQIHYAHNKQWLLPYTNPGVRAAIHLAKFHHHDRARKLLATTLLQYLRSLPSAPLLVPIPLSGRRERVRGYNQVIEIIKSARKIDPHYIHYTTRLLKRVRHTPPQTSLTKERRAHNLTDAFAVNLRAIPDNLHTPVLLLDDVLTTGSTLDAAQAALRAAVPNPISCAALAH